MSNEDLLHHPAERVGARRIQEVPPEVLSALNVGALLTVNHVEHMATDQAQLWTASFPAWADEAHRFRGRRFIDRLRLGGRLLFERLGATAWEEASSAENDMVRAWRAFAVDAADLPLTRGLSAIHRFAVDDHFAVREWSWLAMRQSVCQNPAEAIAQLAESDWHEPRWRRFASEVTRPRSVWGRHISQFKRAPQCAEPLLMRLLSDQDEYVLVSVSNWLNDVAIDHEPWVRQMCRAAELSGRRDRQWLERRATRRVRRPHSLPDP